MYGYTFNDPINYIDPTGNAGIFGAAVGALVEIGFQLASNGGDVSCINWKNVGIAAVFGAIAPGWGTVGKNSISHAKKGYKAYKKISKSKQNKTKRKNAKTAKKWGKSIAGEVGNQAAFQAAGYAAKKLTD